MSELDVIGRAVCASLASTFRLDAPGFASESHSNDNVTIGIEIEVPWSSYFPQLWEKYQLGERRINQLSSQELEQLDADCRPLEDELLPRLRATVACGIPRGNDRYWEFAHRPVTNAQILVDQVSLLSAAGALPRNRAHALHVTVGGIPRCESLYHLALMLEVEFVSPERIAQGIAQMQKTIHTGWGRKGLAGIHQKGVGTGDALEGGVRVASEIRMLQLPASDQEFSRLMTMVQWSVNAIAEMRADIPTQRAAQWRRFEAQAAALLQDNDLPNGNWFKTGPAGGIDLEAWSRFETLLPELRDEVRARWPHELQALNPLRVRKQLAEEFVAFLDSRMAQTPRKQFEGKKGPPSSEAIMRAQKKAQKLRMR